MNAIIDVMVEMDQVSERIETLSSALPGAKVAFLEKKAEYENARSGFILAEKAARPDATQTDVNAVAVTMSHQKRLEMIVAESAFLKIQSDLNAAKLRQDALKEKSYLLRLEYRGGSLKP